MKKVLLVSGLLTFMILQASCIMAQKNAVVGKNSDLSEDFKNLKTYNWTSDIDKIPKDAVFVGPGGVYIFNNESGRKMIKDAIRYELDAKGYKMNKNNPDMLVSFSVLEKPGKLRSVNGYVTVSSGEKVRTKDNVSFKDVKAGTLIVNLIDAKANKAIWQGFASGILQANQMADQTKVREAVSTVFSQFKHDNLK